MELSVTQLDQGCLVMIQGDIDTATAPTLQNALSEELDKGNINAVVDMSKVRYVSSMGLRVFLSHLKKLRTSNGKLLLSGANKLVSDVFVMSGFSNYLEMLPDTESAKKQLESQG